MVKDSKAVSGIRPKADYLCPALPYFVGVCCLKYSEPAHALLYGTATRVCVLLHTVQKKRLCSAGSEGDKRWEHCNRLGRLTNALLVAELDSATM